MGGGEARVGADQGLADDSAGHRLEDRRVPSWAGDPQDGWRRVLGGVRDFRDIEVPLLRSVEELIDFVTAVE